MWLHSAPENGHYRWLSVSGEIATAEHHCGGGGGLLHVSQTRLGLAKELQPLPPPFGTSCSPQVWVLLMRHAPCHIGTGGVARLALLGQSSRKAGTVRSGETCNVAGDKGRMCDLTIECSWRQLTLILTILCTYTPPPRLRRINRDYQAYRIRREKRYNKDTSLVINTGGLGGGEGHRGLEPQPGAAGLTARHRRLLGVGLWEPAP